MSHSSQPFPALNFVIIWKRYNIIAAVDPSSNDLDFNLHKQQDFRDRLIFHLTDETCFIWDTDDISPLWASWQWTESWAAPRRPPWCQQRPGTISWCQERGEFYQWPSSGNCSFAWLNWDNGIQDYHSLDTYFSIDPVLEQFNFHKSTTYFSNFNIPQIYSERFSVLILRSITCLIQLCSKSEQIYLSKNKSACFPVLLWHFWY